MELHVGRDCIELRLAGFKALLANVLSDEEDNGEDRGAPFSGEVGRAGKEEKNGKEEGMNSEWNGKRRGVDGMEL